MTTMLAHVPRSFRRWSPSSYQPGLIGLNFSEQTEDLLSPFGASCSPSLLLFHQVAALLTTQPEEIAQITIEHNGGGFPGKSNSRRKNSVDSENEPDSLNDGDKNFRTRSVSLFSRRHIAMLTPSLSTEVCPHNGEVTFDINGKKITKPAARSNSLPRRYNAQLKIHNNNY